ncbi:apocarotenoid-15,15'-oxygenase-like [Sycon ciliatum]|uniref:apocarotenoid-15,15'-oxygenase-like n=1 Tax=Sycon ciliatum TaxID=27933 RepID=UPI0020A8B3C0|eukprot:scpid47483/ scgid27136/ Apocarotenoid-15,15&apos; 8&apos; Diox1
MAKAVGGGSSGAAPFKILASDIERPLTYEEVNRGWDNLEEERSYWVPAADIEGTIPADLHGTLFRNGPGVNEIYGTILKHPIDGDGMVVAVTFLNGQVHLKMAFVASKHRLEEIKQRRYVYDGQMGTRNRSSLYGSLATLGTFLTTGGLPKYAYRNPSNTNVFYWGGKLLSVYETGLPHSLDAHTLQTLGPDDLGGALTMGVFAAHFRLDIRRMRLVCIALRPGLRRAATLDIMEFDWSWNVVQRKRVSVDGLNYAHDFLLLPDYYVFHMTPFVKISYSQALLIMAGLTSPGETMRYYPDLPSRFVFIPRPEGKCEERDIVQVDTEPFHIYHFGTSEQHDIDTVEFTAVCLDTKFNMEFGCKYWLSNAHVSPGVVKHFMVDLKSGVCKAKKADRASVEFPTTHPYRHGHNGCRFSYLMASDREGHNMPYRDVVKFDIRQQLRQVWRSHGCIGEPVFVPRRGYEGCESGDEDDGYVLVQLYAPLQHRTEFIVLDAKHLDRGPLARVKLLHHIPYGFHGTFAPHVFLPQARSSL